MRWRRLATALVLFATIVLALSARLAHPPLHTDEITYMSSALDSMFLESVFPVKANGALFVNKPPLALWLIRASFGRLEPSPFAARLPSVLAAAATAVVLYLFGAVVFGETVGILAALVFAFTPGLAAIHGIRSATPDSLEVLLVTSAIVGLEVWRRRRWPWALVCLVVCVGATAWVKSPFALIVFLAYLLATELPARRSGRGTPRLLLTLVLVLGVWTAAYSLWLGKLRTETSPRAVKRLLLHQYVRRIQGRLGRDHIAGRDFYLSSVARDFGPLLLLPVGAAAAGWIALRRGRPGSTPASPHDIACVVVWALAAPLLATVSVNKLPWYAYLSYPGIALLLAASAHRLARAASDRRAVQAALAAAVVLVLAWRLPADQLWPAAAQRRGPSGRFWEVARHDSRIEVVAGPGFQFPNCQGEDSCREARFFLRALLWTGPRGPAGTGACRATLINRPGDASGQGDVLELHRLAGQDAALLVVDSCEGWLRGRLPRG